MIKSFCFFVAIIFPFFSLTFPVKAQQPTEEWVRRWPSPEQPNASNGRGIQRDALGNIYVLADTGLGFGFIKYDSDGNLLLSVHHEPQGSWTSGYEQFFTVSPAGDVYITGWIFIELNNWVYTVKYNSNGVLQWDKIYNRDNNDTPEGILSDNMGNVIVYGYSDNGTISHSLLIKYAPNGDTVFTRYYNHGQTAMVTRCACVDNDNNIYTTGYTGFNSKCIVQKYLPSGELSWVTTFTLDPMRPNIGWKISSDSMGNVYVVGTQVRPQSQTDTYLTKIRNNGDTVWSISYPEFGPGNNSIWGPIITKNADFIYYTATYYAPQSGYDIGTLKYDSTGSLIWFKSFNAGLVGGLNIPSELKFDKYENIYVCGGGDFSTTGFDGIILKYTSSGLLHWMTRYTGLVPNGRDFANDIIVDSNIIYITGNSKKPSYSYSDALTIKYDQILGINSNNNEMPNGFILYQNYPNPFNNSTIITYSIPFESYVKIYVYNILGQVINTLFENRQKAGNYSIIINLDGFSSGIYFYKLEAGDRFSETKKLIYLK